MSDNTFEFDTAGFQRALHTRAEVIDALHLLAAEHRTTPASATGRSVTLILAALERGVLTDPGEAVRAETVLWSILDGSDSEFAAERVLDPSLFNTWQATLADTESGARPNRWKANPPRAFADMPTLRQVRVDTSAALALPDQTTLAAAFTELARHTRFRLSEPAWDQRLLQLAAQIAGTLRNNRRVLLTAGQTARAERVFAALVNSEMVGTSIEHSTWHKPELAWAAVLDPEFFEAWRGERATRVGDIPQQQYLAGLAELDRVRQLPITSRPFVNQHNSEFTDMPGLSPLSYLNDDVTYPLLNRDQLRDRFGEVVALATHGPDITDAIAYNRWRHTVHEAAEAILFSARGIGRLGELLMAEALRLERVTASVVALEEPTLRWSADQLWGAMLDGRSYEQLLTERNAVVLARWSATAGFDGTAWDSGRWFDLIESAHNEIAAAELQPAACVYSSAQLSKQSATPVAHPPLPTTEAAVNPAPDMGAQG